MNSSRIPATALSPAEIPQRFPTWPMRTLQVSTRAIIIPATALSISTEIWILCRSWNGWIRSILAGLRKGRWILPFSSRSLLPIREKKKLIIPLLKMKRRKTRRIFPSIRWWERIWIRNFMWPSRFWNTPFWMRLEHR